MTRAPGEACPACGADALVPIVYGFPTYDAAQAEDRGELVIGGCVLGFDDPTHQCKTCGHRTTSTSGGDDVPKRTYEVLYVIEATDDDAARLAANAAWSAIEDASRVDIVEAAAKERQGDGSSGPVAWRGWQGAGSISFAVRRGE